jgi:hypothetical protein
VRGRRRGGHHLERSPTTPITAATTTTTVDPDAALEAEFVGQIEAMAAGIDAADVDAFMDLMQTSMSELERDRAAFFAAWRPFRFTPDDCDITVLSGFRSEATCPVEIVEPVHLEFGPAEGEEILLRYGDGMNLAKGDGTLDPRQCTDSVAAYAEYLGQYLPEEYTAVCDPDGHDTEIRFEHGLTLTGACGELLPTVADDVAEWIRAGRPEA